MKRPVSFLTAAALLVAAPAAFAQQAFETPEAAAEALVAATGAGDPDKVFEIFGPEGRDVLSSGAEGPDKQAFAEFHEAAQAALDVETRTDGSTVVYIGPNHWPFPVELTRTDAGWSFDLEAAREEILLRRIGENELNAIEALEIVVLAQTDFHLRDPDGDQVMEYARHFISAPGEKDGLYWPDADGEDPSPLGPLAAQAAADGYVMDGEEKEPEPFHGYYFRILEKQGGNAPGGAFDYVINDGMVAGFAVIAFPAAYGESGVMTFQVGPAGVIYEKDLGEGTLDEAAAIEAFDLGEGWAPVGEES